MERRAVLLALGAMASLGFPTGCRQRAQAPLRLGTNLWLGYEPFYLARAQGDLDTRQVRLQEFPSASEVMRALRNEVLDAGAVTLDEALTLAEGGVRLDIALVLDVSNGADALLARPEIRDLAALKGRRVGLEASATGAYMLSRALERVGLRPDQVTAVPLPADRHQRAYEAREVDAVVTFDPARTHLLAAGATSLFDSRMIPGEILDVLVVRREAVEAVRPALAHLREAWFAGLASLARQPEAALARVGERLHLTPAQVAGALKDLHLAPPQEEALFRSRRLPEALRALARAMVQAKLMASTEIALQNLQVLP